MPLEICEVIESSWTTIPATPGQAQALRNAGENLVATDPWFGTYEEGEEANRDEVDGDSGVSRSAVEVRIQVTGEVQIRVPERVGILRTRDLQIRVVPKIDERHVIYLMGQGLPGLGKALTVDETVSVAAGEGGFWEVLAVALVVEEERLMRTELLRDYTERIEDLRFVRGRLHLLPTTRAILAGRLQFRNEFEDFTVDTPLNRTLKTAAEVVSGSPELSPETRRRAAALVSRMDEISELRASDLSVELDRRTGYYRDAIDLARHVFKFSSRGWADSGERATAFLIRTPLLIEKGIRRVLDRGLRPTWPVRPRKVPLYGDINESVNPDLVFGRADGVGDVKYSIAGAEWSRNYLYQIVSFATHLQARAATLVNFGSRRARLPRVGVGPIWVTHLVWEIGEASGPEGSAEALVKDAWEWLASLSSERMQSLNLETA